MITSKDIISRTATKFAISTATATKLVADVLDKEVILQAEKYIAKAEIFGLEFRDILRLRTEIAQSTPPELPKVAPKK